MLLVRLPVNARFNDGRIARGGLNASSASVARDTSVSFARCRAVLPIVAPETPGIASTGPAIQSHGRPWPVVRSEARSASTACRRPRRATHAQDAVRPPHDTSDDGFHVDGGRPKSRATPCNQAVHSPRIVTYSRAIHLPMKRRSGTSIRFSRFTPRDAKPTGHDQPQRRAVLGRQQLAIHLVGQDDFLAKGVLGGEAPRASSARSPARESSPPSRRGRKRPPRSLDAATRTPATTAERRARPAHVAHRAQERGTRTIPGTFQRRRDGLARSLLQVGQREGRRALMESADLQLPVGESPSACRSG